MSDESQDDKTEEPTEKRLRDALDKGDAAHSRDLAAALALVGIAISIHVIWSARIAPGAIALRNMLEQAGDARIKNARDAAYLSGAIARIAGETLWPIFGVLFALALAGRVAQGGLRLVASRISPDWSRLSPAKGLRRMIGPRPALEFLKSAGKLIALVGLVAAMLVAARTDLTDMQATAPLVSMSGIGTDAGRILGAVAFVALLFGAADYVMARRAWRRNLKMTRQEVKQQMRESEGDPLVKSRLRAILRERARRRMLNDVRRATVVVVNPTHYAIALRYVREEGGAPLVVAKGRELVAARIREKAEELQIPVVENPTLVRSMYDVVDIGRMIPPDYYKAVAEIINALTRRGVRAPQAAPRPR
ncbi:MAG: flagellar biosynthesis protein FlhB [Hyphomicrobiales bacterium]|nr:flagellar biosynthesis protein FlhB [Hyphomicrobiales bacterium]